MFLALSDAHSYTLSLSLSLALRISVGYGLPTKDKTKKETKISVFESFLCLCLSLSLSRSSVASSPLPLSLLMGLQPPNSKIDPSSFYFVGFRFPVSINHPQNKTNKPSIFFFHYLLCRPSIKQKTIHPLPLKPNNIHQPILRSSLPSDWL